MVIRHISKRSIKALTNQPFVCVDSRIQVFDHIKQVANFSVMYLKCFLNISQSFSLHCLLVGFLVNSRLADSGSEINEVAA